MWAGCGLAGGCALPFGGGRATKKPWTDKELEDADRMMRRSGCKGWAAWENGNLRKSWRTYESGAVMSVTKSIAMMACVRGAGEGWLSADEKVADTLTEWSWQPGKADITVRMLLQMTAGLSDGARELYRVTPRDKGKAALALPLVDVPGVQFRYGPACWEVLGELLERKCKARGTSLGHFLAAEVMGPMNLAAAKWKADGGGQFYLSTGAEMSVTDLGRLGRVLGELLNGRSTSGFKSGPFREMTRVSGANPMFGGGLWHNGGTQEIEVEDVLGTPRDAGFWSRSCLSRRQPRSMVSLIGSAGQRVYVWPESGQVMVRLGYSPRWKDRPLLALV